MIVKIGYISSLLCNNRLRTPNPTIMQRYVQLTYESYYAATNPILVVSLISPRGKIRENGISFVGWSQFFSSYCA